MIRFGPAGIPLSCKGRTLKDGIEDVHNMSLTAMEIQLVRVNTYRDYPEEEDVGKTIRTIDNGLVLEIVRDDCVISDPDEFIEEDDELIFLNTGIVHNFAELGMLGDMAKRLDVSVSLHTPNYIDLGSNSDLTPLCMNYLRYAGQLVNELNGDVVVTSLGLYDGSCDREEIEDNIVNNLGDLVDWWQGAGLKPKIGIEITGQQDVYGSLDQVLDLCDIFGDAVVPVLDFSHYHSRGCGCLVEPADYVNVIDQVLPYCDGKFYARFAGVEHDGDGNELRLTPIKKGDLVFEKLGDALADMCPDGTIISSSPLLEHDAMYMRIIYERMVNKRVAKAIRASKKKESEGAED